MSEERDKSIDKLVGKIVDEELGGAAPDAAEDSGNIDAEADRARKAIEGAIDAASAPKGEGDGPIARGAASARSTSGAGFAFEDEIAAWLLVRMMSGVPIHGFEASGVRLQFQTSALGHGVDDLHITGLDADEAEVELLLSCKSGLEVGPSGFRSDFVAQAWTGWDRLEADKRARVKFALVTRGRHDGFEKTWTDIQDWIGAGVSDLGLARIRASAKHARVFDSLADEPARDNAAIGALAGRILSISVDFQTANSKDEEAAIERCRKLLASGAWSEARELWQTLRQLAETARIGHGVIRVSELWAKLRARFALTDHPDHAAAWTALRRVSQDCRQRVEIALPNGHVMRRDGEAKEVAALLRNNRLIAVHGESGVGKSALVVNVLEESFAHAAQVWLGPEELASALSVAGRTQLGLRQPLDETLRATAHAENVLVIDAAERLAADMLPALRKLVTTITEGRQTAWRLVIIAQTETGANAMSALGVAADAAFELGEAAAGEVREALRSSARIGWLASHADAVAALGNLGALSFVAQAEAMFTAQGDEIAFSKSVIADRLWDWWTNGDAAFGGLLMRLAVREANFERSFALSELDAADALVFNQRSARAPVRLNRFNRIEFIHDMASDWARYRRLREIAAEPDKWQGYAANPLWLAALRLLGEVLLRERIHGQPGWDFALQRLEEGSAGRDVLLEALALDPMADLYLQERAGLLLDNDGVLLKRLAGRFLHVATRANVPVHIMALDRSLRVHFETQHRAPLQARWPALIRFFAARREQVAALLSQRIARLCEIWLTRTPQKSTDGSPYPYRVEMADLAVATVRALQLVQGTTRVIFADGTEPVLYAAAFAASPDRLDEVAAWALEMSGRQPINAALQSEIAAYRARQAQKHAERMKSDAEYRERYENSRSMGGAIGFSDRRLPPWPLGARRRIERRFRACCLHKGVLGELMKVRPDAAGEILLACIIEDEPKERQDRHEQELGLAFDSESYPTIYWHSAFVTFLLADGEAALRWLAKLVDFATERWTAPGEARAPSIVLDTKHGARKYLGGYGVFDWGQSESTHNGQLFCALAALEFWLCMRLEAKHDLTDLLERLLGNAKSAAWLGVLVNIAKQRPELLQGPLLPLIASEELHHWDTHRVTSGRDYRFNAGHWVRSGEQAYEMAKAWAFAPRRETTLSAVSLDLAFKDAGIAEALRAATAAWPRPDDEKDRIELEIRAAQLNTENYVEQSDGAREFVAPPALAAQVKAFDEAHAPKRRLLTLPIECLYFLKEGGSLHETAPAKLAEFMALDPQTGADEEEIGQIVAARVAAAATLLARGQTFLDTRPDLAVAANALIDDVIDEIGEDIASLRRARFDLGGYETHFAVFAAVAIWIDNPGPQTGAQVLRLISSRRSGVITTLSAAVRAARDRLGARADAFGAAVKLWAGLSALTPSYDADAAEQKRWEGWLRRYRRLDIARLATLKLDLSDLAERVDRIGALRRVFDDDTGAWRRRHRREASGLDADVLHQLYDQMLDYERRGAVDSAEDRAAAVALWNEQARSLRSRVGDEDGDYGLPEQLGYHVLQALARMTAFAPSAEAEALWRPVLSVGVRGHNAVDHFLGSWFIQAHSAPEPEHFLAQWRAMAQFLLSDAGWTGKDLWYRREAVWRQALGFNAEKSLARLTNARACVAQLWDLYETWTRAHLITDDDNIAAFAGFLASDVAADIRLRGCKEIAARLDDTSYWRRDRVGASLVDLVDTILTHNGEAMSSAPDVREAVLRILAVLVAHGVDGALVLQERIRQTR